MFLLCILHEQKNKTADYQATTIGQAKSSAATCMQAEDVEPNVLSQ